MFADQEAHEETTLVEEDAYLTRREAAAHCRVPLSTFDALRRQSRVPYPDARMGKHMLRKTSTIVGFLESGGTSD